MKFIILKQYFSQYFHKHIVFVEMMRDIWQSVKIASKMCSESSKKRRDSLPYPNSESNNFITKVLPQTQRMTCKDTSICVIKWEVIEDHSNLQKEVEKLMTRPDTIAYLQ